MSFRQTISGVSWSDRGFMAIVDRVNRKVLISFDSSKIDDKHAHWRDMVNIKTGLTELNPQPYWGFDDLEHKAGTKLLNCFFVQAESKREKGQTFFRYSNISILQKFKLEGLLKGIEQGFVYIDFDARTGHNHGTKFRLRRNKFSELYDTVIEI